MSATETVLEVARALLSEQSVEREQGADEVTDIVGSLEPRHVDLLVKLLVRLRLNEKNSGCREALLNALSELAAVHEVDKEVLRLLRTLETSELSPSEMEHLAQLLPPEAG